MMLAGLGAEVRLLDHECRVLEFEFHFSGPIVHPSVSRKTKRGKRWSRARKSLGRSATRRKKPGDGLVAILHTQHIF
jgi:hypothetical protein